MERIAFYFDDMSVPVLGEKTAPSGTLSAGGRIPCGLAGDDIFRWDDIGDEGPGRFGRTTDSGACTSQPNQP